MGLVRYFQSVFPACQSLGNVLLKLVKEIREVNDHAVTNNRVAALPDDTTGKEVEVIFLVPHNDCMARIVAALAPKSTQLHNILIER